MDVFGKLTQYDFGEVHFCLDKSTQLKTIVAIHDSRLGPALGGCRFIEYDTDADAYYDEWSSRVEIRRPPRNEHGGARTFDVIDPFGNTIFVMGPTT